MFELMRKITSKLRAILALLRGILCKVVHRITYAINPLYRSLYELLRIEIIYDEHKEQVMFREIGNDMYYTSPEYRKDSAYSTELLTRIKMLQEKVKEMKKKGY